jgi:hypothetical protein
MLKAARRAVTVETSALGELEPSTVANSGSVPWVAVKRDWIDDGVIDKPWSS